MMYFTKSHDPLGSVCQAVRMFDSWGRTENEKTRSFLVDITETDEAYLIEADLPGYSAEEVNLKVDNNLLTIESRPKDGDSPETEDSRRLLQERLQGEFARSFTIPDDVEKESMEASMAKGHLSLTLKKRASAKPWVIPVKG